MDKDKVEKTEDKELVTNCDRLAIPEILKIILGLNCAVCLVSSLED